MIKDTELRKGNAIYYNPNGNPFLHFVSELHWNFLMCNEPGDKEQRFKLYYDNNHLQPIPLTPRILEQCGFVKKEVKPGLIRNCLQIKPYLLFGYYEEEVLLYDSELRWIADVQYLHQLQNLYHSLTGHELEIKIPLTA